MWLFDFIVFLIFATPIFRGMDISKCFRESPLEFDIKTVPQLLQVQCVLTTPMPPTVSGCYVNEEHGDIQTNILLISPG